MLLFSLSLRKCYSAHGAYAQSKLALLLFSYHLQDQLWAKGDPVTVNAVDPGMVDTALYDNLCGPAQLAKKPFAKLLFRVRRIRLPSIKPHLSSLLKYSNWMDIFREPYFI